MCTYIYIYIYIILIDAGVAVGRDPVVGPERLQAGRQGLQRHLKRSCFSGWGAGPWKTIGRDCGVLKRSGGSTWGRRGISGRYYMDRVTGG